MDRPLEFRVFLPLLTKADASWMHPGFWAEYQHHITEIKNELIVNKKSFGEKRKDRYLVGYPHYGIKYRSENKLEIKIRKRQYDASDRCAEDWGKIKLGKGRLAEKRSNIVTLLQDMGYADRSALDLANMKNERFVTASKKRKAMSIGSIQLEVCKLKVFREDDALTKSSNGQPECDSDSDAEIDTPEGTDACGKDVGEGSTPVLKPRRKWVSFAVEGTLNGINNFLDGNDTLQAVWWAYSIAHRVSIEQPDECKATFFLPVVGGYPTWCRYVGGAESGTGVDDAEFAAFQADSDAFLKSLRTKRQVSTSSQTEQQEEPASLCLVS
jgi:hypothetical protein